MKTKQSTKRFIITVLGVMIFFSTLQVHSYVMEKDGDLIVGKAVKIQSKILGEERLLWVCLPYNYKDSKDKYPVLYLLDGRYHFLHVSGIVEFLSKSQMPRMIVVAVANVDRNRDFLPSRVDGFPAVAANGKFMSFIKEELIPAIDKKFRTSSSRILCGHSYGGLFTMDLMLTYPDLFNGYIAISSSIYWDNRMIFKKAEEFFKKHPKFKKLLYFTVAGGDREAILKANQDFKTFLEKNAPPGFSWNFRFMEKEDHGTTVHRGIYDALEWFYKDWMIAIVKLPEMSVEDLCRHYEKLSKKLGYTIPVPSRVLNGHSILLLRNEKPDEAIKSLKFYMTKYPVNSIMHFRMGMAYEQKKELKAAQKAYKKAVELAEKENHHLLDRMKQILAEVEKKLKQQK